MVEIIISAIFIASVAGIAIIVRRTMPRVQQVAESSSQIKQINLAESLKTTLVALIKKNPHLKDFSWMDFMQKILLKGRVLVMKAENKISDYILKLKKRSEEQQKKEATLLDNYWHDLRTIVKTKKLSQKKDTKTPTVKPATDLKIKTILPHETSPRPITKPKRKRVLHSQKKSPQNSL